MGKIRKASGGSPTNASDAVDDIELPPDASPEEVVDAGVQESFPASDPPAIQKAFEHAEARSDEPAEIPQPPRKSADWMLKPPR
jgi:hypothetical protein